MSESEDVRAIEDHRVTIERKYIPLCQVLKQEPVAAALSRRGIRSGQPELARLAQSGRTLSQYICFSEKKDLHEEILAAVKESLEEADRIAPVYLEEQYPWLREPRWGLEMRDVSYYKVTAQFSAETFVNIRQVHCEQDTAGEGAILWLDFEAADGFYGERAQPMGSELQIKASFGSDGQALKIVVRNREALQQVMKQLLLCGNLDLR